MIIDGFTKSISLSLLVIDSHTAWKDTQIILFIITLIDAQITVSWVRKRLNKKDKWIKQVFRDQPFKRLKIPDFINMYNHLMNGVD